MHLPAGITGTGDESFGQSARKEVQQTPDYRGDPPRAVLSF